MQTHWTKSHPVEYAQIRRWLGETDAKIARTKVLAEEGMQGLKYPRSGPGTEHLPKSHRADIHEGTE
jgi:hypothetical protein